MKKYIEYSLSTNFDVSSATKTANLIDVSAQVGAKALLGLTFSPDGKKMFVMRTKWIWLASIFIKQKF